MCLFDTPIITAPDTADRNDTKKRRNRRREEEEAVYVGRNNCNKTGQITNHDGRRPTPTTRVLMLLLGKDRHEMQL